MGMSAISHYRYDLDRYASELNRIAILASTYFIEDPSIRNAYVRDVADFISNAYRRFNTTFDPNEKARIVYEVRDEKENEERDYQKFRMGNYVKRVVTEIYEEQGVFKYRTVVADLISSGVIMGGGFSLYFSGNRFHSNKLKILGFTLIAHAWNDAFETVAPLFMDREEPGIIRKIYRYGAKKLGYDNYGGDLSYSAGEMILSIYAGVYGFQKVSSRHSVMKIPVLKKMLGKRDTGKLYYYVTQDFVTKWSSRTRPMKIFFIGNQMYKAKIEFFDNGYKLNDE